MMNVSADKAHDAHHEHESTSVDLFGFWVYILTDCILFATLFTVFIVLGGRYEPYEFNMGSVLAETFVLLTSSFTCGLAVIKMNQQDSRKLTMWLLITMILGLVFLYLELSEFAELFAEGNGWDKNAYFSSFFALVGTHGLHVSFGILWIIVLIMQIKQHGLHPRVVKKVLLLSLFWHFLDIIWIFVYSIVYLIGGI